MRPKLVPVLLLLTSFAATAQPADAGLSLRERAALPNLALPELAALAKEFEAAIKKEKNAELRAELQVARWDLLERVVQNATRKDKETRKILKRITGVKWEMEADGVGWWAVDRNLMRAQALEALETRGGDEMGWRSLLYRGMPLTHCDNCRCAVDRIEREYLALFPRGAHVDEALAGLSEGVNHKTCKPLPPLREPYATALRKTIENVRPTLAKVDPAKAKPVLARLDEIDAAIPRYGFVAALSQSLKEKPDPAAGSVVNAPIGSVVQVLPPVAGEWTRVKWQEKEGFLPAKALRPLSPYGQVDLVALVEEHQATAGQSLDALIELADMLRVNLEKVGGDLNARFQIIDRYWKLVDGILAKANAGAPLSEAQRNVLEGQLFAWNGKALEVDPQSKKLRKRADTMFKLSESSAPFTKLADELTWQAAQVAAAESCPEKSTCVFFRAADSYARYLKATGVKGAHAEEALSQLDAELSKAVVPTVTPQMDSNQQYEVTKARDRVQAALTPFPPERTQALTARLAAP